MAKFQRAQGSYSLLPSTPPSGELEGDGARGAEQAAPRTHTLAVCTFFLCYFFLLQCVCWVVAIDNILNVVIGFLSCCN